MSIFQGGGPERTEHADELALDQPSDSISSTDTLDPGPQMEVSFRQVLRSKEPVNKIDGTKKNIKVLRSWNDYSIVILESGKTVIILDEEGNPREDFSNLDKISIDVNLRDHMGTKEYLTDRQDMVGAQSIHISKLPPLLHKTGVSILIENAKQYVYIPGTSKIHFSSLNPEISTIENGKYIIIGDKNEGPYLAFCTTNEAGVIQSPGNWKRFDPTTKVVPLDLVEYFRRIEKTPGEFKDIGNDRYGILVTDVGINFVEKSDINSKPVFSEISPGIGQNITVDPINNDIVYFCKSASPKEILRIDISGEPQTWQTISATIPNSYRTISNLQLDPTGNFFLFYSDNDLVILSKDTLEEVKKMPGLTNANFDSTGNIRAIDEEGHLVILDPNFTELAVELDRKRIAKLTQNIQIANVFDHSLTERNEVQAETIEHLEPIRQKYREEFDTVIQQVTTLEGIRLVRHGLSKLREILKQNGLKTDEINFVIEGLEEPILEKERGFAVVKVEETLTIIEGILNAGLSITSIGEARAKLDEIKGTEALLSDDLRQKYRNVAADLERKSLEFFQQRGGEVIKEVHGLLARTRTDLEGFSSKSQMDDWLEFRCPQLKSRLGSLAQDVPLEADDAYKAIMHARENLQELASEFEEKFKKEYAKVREKAVERVEGAICTLEADIEGLVDRLRTKGFTDRGAAEHYLETSEARKALVTEIEVLAGNTPDTAKELQKALKVRLSNALTEIERGGMTKVAETGQQMILIGKTYFPKWEAKVKVKEEREVDVYFEEDARTHGPGLKAGDILGDVCVRVKTSEGKVETVRLYEGWYDENEWRLGLHSYRGEEIPPSYLSASEYKNFKRDYQDWKRDEKSTLRRELEERKNRLKFLYSTRQKISERNQDEDVAWKEKYEQELKDYAKFVNEHHILLLKRIDKIENEPEIEHTNGRGYVPEWQSHWVNDGQTEKDLEEMAVALKMQLDLQEGILNLKGHAGTGKDVRMKMFCALTNRPYFGIDGTKWTTEFELSEDVMLESVDGASQTIKVPSAVLNGITTPGAVVYFNEFNAMPEQAQIFLHALMDEKRSLTLKTSSGRVIRALPSILLTCSMNPGYPGTFEPQFATRSRMVSLEIGYPPLTRPSDPKDKNRNPLFDASEALRIARSLDSLSDLTYEANLERNEFVLMWDKYVNGIDNGAPEPNIVQKFDIDVSLTLIQFANMLRDDFMKIFEKSRDSRNALRVTQPITGRELRRCAYALSKMPPEDKATSNPEAVARNLLEKYFLTHIDKKEDRDTIKTAMQSWSSKRRVRA